MMAPSDDADGRARASARYPGCPRYAGKRPGRPGRHRRPGGECCTDIDATIRSITPTTKSRRPATWKKSAGQPIAAGVWTARDRWRRSVAGPADDPGNGPAPNAALDHVQVWVGCAGSLTGGIPTHPDAQGGPQVSGALRLAVTPTPSPTCGRWGVAVLLRIRRRRPEFATRPKPSPGRQPGIGPIELESSGGIPTALGRPKPPRCRHEPLAQRDPAESCAKTPPSRRARRSPTPTGYASQRSSPTTPRCVPVNSQAWNCATATRRRRGPHPRGQATGLANLPLSRAEAMPPGGNHPGRHRYAWPATKLIGFSAPDLATNANRPPSDYRVLHVAAPHFNRGARQIRLRTTHLAWAPRYRRMANDFGPPSPEQQLTAPDPRTPTGRGGKHAPSDTGDLPCPFRPQSTQHGPARTTAPRNSPRRKIKN